MPRMLGHVREAAADDLGELGELWRTWREFRRF
jgi:hypothetical protein